jgi:hypothetical protein
MQNRFISKYFSEFRYTFVAGICIVVVAYAVIAGIVLAVPHLPLANKRTFYGLLRAQMAVDEGQKLPALKREMVLFLGSSVVERGVSELSMDSVFNHLNLSYETMNAGTGGFCADANLPMFRAMLDDGLKPEYVVYGVSIQELNGASTVHAFFETKDTASVKLKPKTLWNIIRYGPTALAPLMSGDHFHQYVFAANNAFRDVPNLNLFNRLMFGENSPPRDSAYVFNPIYLNDLKEIITICQSRGIHVAIYNAPLRKRAPDEVDIPYQHRGESYEKVLKLAQDQGIPCWNFDRTGLFDTSEFQDNYHLTPIGAKKVSIMLADSIFRWQSGAISQDGMETLE